MAALRSDPLYLIKRTECLQMPHKSISENALLCNAKAVYYPNLDGSLRLARVQVFNTPRFKPLGWEAVQQDKNGGTASEKNLDEAEADAPQQDGGASKSADVARSVRRARRNAFDLIMCNPDLNAFVTYTYSPDSVESKSNYEECYKYLRSHLSNGVQRDDLKYICVPELTKKGDVHFHSIANGAALRLKEARSAKSGRLLKHNGDQVYNLTNWHAGFSTAQLIRRRDEFDDPREAVAKYIFKYMGKNFGAKIGGRYMLHGGKLAHPLLAYGDGVEQFADADDLSQAQKYAVELPEGGKYLEYDFLHVGR